MTIKLSHPMSSLQMTSNDGFNASECSLDGVPLDPPCRVSSVATDAGTDEPARRLDNHAPQTQLLAVLFSAPPPPQLRSELATAGSKRPSPGDVAHPTKALRLGPAVGSLIDDHDDDELVDYFGGGVLGCPVVLPADDVADPGAPWRVCECHVRALPPCYPLEKSSVVVRSAAGVIAARVAAVLEARDIEASYDAPSAMADCFSADKVEFRLRLYRERGEGEDIIVEVQRRVGYSLSYFQDVFAILDAVQGKELEEPEIDCSH